MACRRFLDIVASADDVPGHRITINICQLGQFPFDGGRLRVGLACLLRLSAVVSAVVCFFGFEGVGFCRCLIFPDFCFCFL